MAVLPDRFSETHLPTRTTIRLEELNAASPAQVLAAARELLLDYGRFVIAQPGAGRFCFGTLQQEAERLPMSFAEQGGGCLLAWARGNAEDKPGDEQAGVVAWRVAMVNDVVVPDSWEMKRLWVSPSHRGLGIGRLLTDAVVDRAIAARRKAVYLDTAPESMASAHRLYLDMGFVPCAQYNDNPVEGLAYMVKFLS